SVLQESAKAALSYIRAHSKELKVPSNFFQTSDIHIHIPAGAIQKDGPSAGITLTISLISLLTGRPVRSDVAMTGEITLRGKVLPVGGIKEKVLAAARAGIKHIILPKHNKKDLHDLPEVVTKKLQFHFAEKISDAVKFAFTGRAAKKKRGRSTSRSNSTRRVARHR
ncbi:MAG: S16 family serine protease, partial [Planctomycetota bacterium]